MKKIRKWKMWALVDRKDTYESSVYGTRMWARAERNRWLHLEDALWEIVPVEVRELPTRGKP